MTPPAAGPRHASQPPRACEVTEPGYSGWSGGVEAAQEFGGVGVTHEAVTDLGQPFGVVV